MAAVCHGPGALVNGKKPNGEPIVKGHKVTGFSNEEEIAVGLHHTVPFSLEDRLKFLGGNYVRSIQVMSVHSLQERGPNWQAYAVADGRLVTGQVRDSLDPLRLSVRLRIPPHRRRPRS